MESILWAFPDAKFISIVRDGVDVVHSWLKRPDYEGLAGPARRWRRAVSTARKFSERHGDRIVEVRYEKLCQDPEEVVRDIYQFLDLSWREDLLTRSDHYGEMPKDQSVEHFENAFGPISTENIGKGRRNLTKKQKQMLAPLIDDLLVEIGYDPIQE
jgi:glutamine synthetase adenylyltransferase